MESNSSNYRGPSPWNLVGAYRAAQGFQGSPQRGAVVLENVHGAGTTEFPGRCDHPDRELVVRDFQFHRLTEKVQDGRLELAAGEELEAWTVRAVVNEDADKLPHHRFRVVHKLGDPAPDVAREAG